MKQNDFLNRSNGRNKSNRNKSNRSKHLDNNSSNVRVRGNTQQVIEKYLTLARDAIASSDRILAESFYQYAEHYRRLRKSEIEKKDRKTPSKVEKKDKNVSSGVEKKDKTSNIVIESNVEKKNS